MENVSTLKDLAMGMANNQMPPSMESEIPTPEEAVARSQQKDVSYIGDTPVIIAPSSKNSDNPMSDLMRTPTPVPSVIGLDMDTLQTPVMDTPLDRMTPPGINTPDKPNMQMSDATLTMLGEIMPDLSVEQRVELARPIIETKPGIVKDLIINMGFTQEEAQTAADNQIRKRISEKYADYRNNIETTAVVTINKTDDPNSLGLTKEEHMKLEKVKKVRLVVVEDMELANIKIERPDEEYKADYVKSIEGSLSKYSVPMPMLGDFVSFRGNGCPVYTAMCACF